jgi:alpha-L-fucosidase
MGSLTLTNMGDKIKYVQFLHDASEIKFSAGTDANKNNLNLELPIPKPPTEIPVLEVFLK